ncbi:MAG: CBS domain-containing protein [Actinomycetota bacterium]|nr:CBS domain-containing protein [Actinomycetota bacterium]MDQ2958918.1 CBS domain-containing protein [Actinomycetota bacterium]
MSISEILRRKGSAVVTIEPDATVTELVRTLGEHKIGAVVVVRDGQTVGIVSERDVVRRLDEVGAAVLELAVSELMSAEVISCGPDDALDDIAEQMTERRIRHLPVLADGKLAGIVTIGDVVAARIRELEQTRVQLESYITQG